MHNLTVDGLHTYYVVAGNTPVLVHNTGGCPRNTKGQFTSGENVDAARDRITHQNYRTALGDGYDYEFTIPSDLRPDVIDWNDRVVHELKSDAASSQAAGRRRFGRLCVGVGTDDGPELDRYSRHLFEVRISSGGKRRAHGYSGGVARGARVSSTWGQLASSQPRPVLRRPPPAVEMGFVVLLESRVCPG
nr:hypothetical protein [Salinispora vitiensis]